MGCTKSLVSKIFCLNSNEDLQAMQTIWEGNHDSSLADRLRSELSGGHESLILHLLKSGRGDGEKDEGFCSGVADELHRVMKNGKTMMGGLSSKAEREVGELLCQVPPPLLPDLKRAWEGGHGKKDGSLRSVLEKRLSGGVWTADRCTCSWSVIVSFFFL